MGVLIQPPHGELCPMTPVKFQPKKAKSQQPTLHHAQPSPTLPAERQAARERALSMGCVCIGLIMIRRMFDFPLNLLDNKQTLQSWTVPDSHRDLPVGDTDVSTPGRSLVCTAEAAAVRGLVESPPLLTPKPICFCSKSCLLISRKNT